MASPRRWSTTEDAELRTLHASGKSLHEIAKTMGWAKDTVSRHAARLGLPWDRAQVTAATQAKTADAKARRADLKHHLLEDAARLREQLFAPTLAFNFGGKDNTYNEHQLDKPPFADQLKIMQAAGTAIATYDRLEKLDGDNGATEAVGMLNAIADAIKTAATALDTP